MAGATDIHQHLWPPAVLRLLAGRTEGPRARPAQGRRWTLELPGEPPSTVLRDDRDRIADRALQAASDGIARALLVPPVTLGIERWAGPDEVALLLDAWHDAARSAGAPFGHWAGVDARTADVAELTRRLDEGAVGLCLPADALADPAAVDRVGSLLELLERRSAPLIVHPGGTPPPPGGAPAAWWPALADYVPQLLRAWGTLLAVAPATHPALRVAFVALAGGAPLMLERLGARGGPTEAAAGPGWFYETSSFGPRAVAHAAAAVGPERLVHGSDRPVLDGPAADLPPRALVAGTEALLGPVVAARPSSTPATDPHLVSQP